MSIMKEEIWKDIPGFEGYQVSNLGNVRSLPREMSNYRGKFISKERILKPNIVGGGYYSVNIRINNKGYNKKIHQLVAMSFLNHKPDGTTRIVVDHINNISTDNRLKNLQLISHRENISKDRNNCKSIYTGVFWYKKSNRWMASITINYKQKYLGIFTSEEEASECYQNALKAIENNEEIIVKKPIFTSNYKGVCWDKYSNKWRAMITINGKGKHIGSFYTEKEANEAYQNKLKEIQNESR